MWGVMQGMQEAYVKSLHSTSRSVMVLDRIGCGSSELGRRQKKDLERFYSKTRQQSVIMSFTATQVRNWVIVGFNCLGVVILEAHFFSFRSSILRSKE